MLRNITVFLSALVFCIPIYAEQKSGVAKPDFDSFWASVYVARLKHVESYEVLQNRLSLSKKDYELADNFYKTKAASFEKPVIKLVGKKIYFTFAKAKLSVDFKTFAKGSLQVNNTNIRLKRHKTYLNYLSEIQLALPRKSAANSFIDYLLPSAFADSIADSNAAFVAHLFAHSSKEHPHLFDAYQGDSHGSLADWIIKAYVKEAKNDQRRNNFFGRRDNSTHLNFTSFTCQNNDLNEVRTRLEETVGARRNMTTESLKRTSAGWEIHEGGRVKVIINRDGRVSGHKNEPNCPPAYERYPPLACERYPIGINIFEGYRWDGSRGINLRACCAESGCYQKVADALGLIHIRKRTDPRGRHSNQ